MAEQSLVTVCPKCGSKPHSQDQIYGEGLRVHIRKPNSQLCCTVCSNVKGDAKAISDTTKKKAK
jgi:hypothetical protein